MDREVPIRLGGALLLAPAVYWLLATVPVDLGAVRLDNVLLLLPSALFGLALLAAAVACLLGRAAGVVAGATLGLASAATSVARLLLTTERERAGIAVRFGVESTWWLAAVAVCGVLAGAALLAAPSLRADSEPGGGQIARLGWRWSVVAVAVIEISFAVGMLNLQLIAPAPLSGTPGVIGSVVLGLLWLGSMIVAIAVRSVAGLALSSAIVLAALVMQLVYDARGGQTTIPGVADNRVWLGVFLLLTAGFVVWLLPVLRGWTPGMRHEMEARPKGLFD